MPWLKPLGFALLALVIAAFILPFRAQFIELRPDGSNLRTITASEIRFAGLVISLLPIAVLGVVVLLSKRFRTWGTPWKWTGSTLLLALIALAWVSEHVSCRRAIGHYCHARYIHYDKSLAATKTLTLGEQAKKFQEHLAAVKSYTPLDPRVTWYPWQTLGQIQVLHTFLQGDTSALMNMIGRDTALDVGCGDGDIAFFLESLGTRVDAIDQAPTNYNALLGVQALKQALNSTLRIHSVDLDTRPTLPSITYGFTVMLGVLYHLKNPFLVLEALARSSRYIFLSTRIASMTPDGKTNFGALPMAYLVDERELNNDETNFWIFSEKSLERIIRRSGWDVLHYSTAGPVDTSDPVTPGGDARAFVLAKSRLAAPPVDFRLLHGWHRLELDSWRWTERRFTLEVDSPIALSPATLEFTFKLPAVMFTAHPHYTLSARVNGTDLPPRIYATPGEHKYSASIPALPAGPITVEFELDRAMGPTETDRRELGLIVEFRGPSPVMLS